MLNFYFGLNGRVRRTSAILGTLSLQGLGALGVYLWSVHLGVPVFDDPHNRILAPEIKPVFVGVAAISMWSSCAVLWKRLNDVDEDLQGRFMFMKMVFPILSAFYLAIVFIGDVSFGEIKADVAGIPLALIWAFFTYLPPEPYKNEFGPNPRSRIYEEVEQATAPSPLEERMQRLQPQTTRRIGTQVGTQRVTRPAPQPAPAMSGFGKRVRT